MLRLDWHELENKNEKSYSTFFMRGVALSIGSFDGLHNGHRALLKRLIEKSKKLNLPCGVLTFSSSPRYLFNFSPAYCISTLRLKLENLEKLGLDFVILVDFSLNFAKMSGERFVELLKKYINLQYLLVGADFRFGRERSSSIEDMNELSSKFSFSFEAFSNVLGLKNETKISSSLIRKAIFEGDIKIVSSFLQDGFDIDLLNAKPHQVEKGYLYFLKEDLQQVLPKAGEFLSILRFSTGREKEIRVMFDEKFVRLMFNNGGFNEDVPHFNILKLKERI